MSNERALAAVDVAPAIDTAVLHKLVVEGDLSKLDADQQVNYYRTMCEATGLDYRTRPFAFIRLNGKLVLYALREATEQLRHRQNVSVEIVDRQLMGEVYVVTARATLPNGRTDASTGAVAIATLKGEALANAYMKAETKAKRRVTLSICGLGLMDESEAIDIPGAEYVGMHESGAVKPAALPQPTGSGPLDPIGRKRAAELYRQLTALGNYVGADIEDWMLYHGFDSVQDMPNMTEAQADALKRDSVQRKRPWEAPMPDPEPVNAAFSEAELAAMDDLDLEGDGAA